jgi:NitT/TauT family transport system permease protein
MAIDRANRLEEEIEGLDALDIPLHDEPVIRSRGSALWSAAWPKLLAVGLILLAWQVVVWSHLRPEYALPAPATALKELFLDAKTAEFWGAVSTTMRRAFLGFALAIVIGTAIGLGVSRSPILRRAFGSIITGLQSMPSVVWAPFAIVIFRDKFEWAVLFVVILGAAPSIANGLVSGVDHIPPLLLRAGRVMGARGASALRHVVLPAALPGYVAGLKQGWAFGWRSLMAAEIIAQGIGGTSIGGQLYFSYSLSDMGRLIEFMIVVLLVGIIVDTVLFAKIETALRRRRGLIEVGATA